MYSGIVSSIRGGDRPSSGAGAVDYTDGRVEALLRAPTPAARAAPRAPPRPASRSTLGRSGRELDADAVDAVGVTVRQAAQKNAQQVPFVSGPARADDGAQ